MNRVARSIIGETFTAIDWVANDVDQPAEDFSRPEPELGRSPAHRRAAAKARYSASRRLAQSRVEMLLDLDQQRQAPS